MKPISLPENRRLDPVLVRVLSRVDEAAKSLGVSYLLTGAMAREILLVHVHGLPIGRATRDVDFGVQVQDWGTFTSFKQALLHGGGIEADATIQHRVYTRAELFGLRMPVDLVPFGPLESPAGIIRWPAERDVVMDVRGFHIGLEQVQAIEVEPGLVIPIPRVEAMIVMKALAWKDRAAATQGRDALDLVELLERGEDLLGLETLYDSHLEVVEHHGGDPRLAGAEVLGRNAKACAPPELAREVHEILCHGLETNLVTQVMAGRGGRGGSRMAAAVENLVRACIRGLG